jgi:hypothetical protein
MTSDVAWVAGARDLGSPPFFSRAGSPEGGAPTALPSSHARTRRLPFFPASVAQMEMLRRTKAELHRPACRSRAPPEATQGPELPASSPFRGNHMPWRPRARSRRLHAYTSPDRALAGHTMPLSSASAPHLSAVYTRKEREHVPT